MHKSLQRQLKRTVGLADAAALDDLLSAAAGLAVQSGVDPAVAALLGNLGAFLERVDAAYVQADRDLELRTRSLEISSQELMGANARLRQDIDERNRAVQSLRATVSELLGRDELGGAGDADELAALSRIVANLVQEREKQRVLLDNIRFALDQHAIVSITDTRGTIIYANDKFCEISGYSRAELMGSNHRIVKSGCHPDALYAEMWETITAGRTWHGEICNRARQGQAYWVAATIVPFLDEFGLPFEYIAIRTDITARKQAETDLMHARDVAEAASLAKGEFLANVSHEIRTPMNGIIGMTELVLDTPLDVEQREYMQIVKSSADALLTLINDILDFSKIEAGKLTVEHIEFELRQVFEETLAPLRLRAGQKGLQFGLEIDAGVPTQVIGDPVRLRQVLVNLVGNAVKFTERGGITVGVRVEASAHRATTLLISVRDSGIGIPDDKLAQVFEAFSQADSSTTRKYGGTGLGLTISSRLVELMGGSMEVASTLGIGSTFSFSLPLGVPEHAPAAAALAEKLQEIGMEAFRMAEGDAPVFDYARALDEMDAEILAQVIPIFLDGYTRDVDALVRAVAADDASKTLHCAHVLKGILAVFGADPAQRRAAEIELLARGGQVSAAADLLAGLRHEIETLAGVLRRRH
ncbi:MAG: ATP-binding protein [Rhodocyclaceae bacterium]|jgi:PAS domain S-box-containing protein|nr:ATP-binding protein [Rhodocyclaceae bacterium]